MLAVFLLTSESGGNARPFGEPAVQGPSSKSVREDRRDGHQVPNYSPVLCSLYSISASKLNVAFEVRSVGEG